MKRVRITRVGARSAPARMCSCSRRWPSRLGRRYLGTATTTTGAGIADAPGVALFARMGSMLWSAMLLPRPMPTLCVRLLQLTLGPLHRVLGLHALDGLGVHVHEDVLDQGLGRLPAGHAGIAGPPTELDRLLEGNELGILLPQRMPLPVGGRADDVAVVCRHPLVILRSIHEPAEELLRYLLVLGVLHDGTSLPADIVEAPARALRHLAVARDLGDVGELPLGDEVDARSVDRRRDRPGKVSAVVAAVVPGQPALVEAVLPDGDGELHGLERLFAVDDDLPALVDLGPSEAPGHRVGPVVGIAQAVAEGLPHGLPFLLERDPHLAPLVPGVGELVGARLLEPVLAVRPGGGNRAERHRLPAIADDADLLVVLVVGAV